VWAIHCSRRPCCRKLESVTENLIPVVSHHFEWQNTSLPILLQPALMDKTLLVCPKPPCPWFLVLYLLLMKLIFSDLLRKMSLAFRFFNKQNNHANQVTKNYVHEIMLLLTYSLVDIWTYDLLSLRWMRWPPRHAVKAILKFIALVCMPRVTCFDTRHTCHFNTSIDSRYI
jgi:hypothetical protein